MTEAELKSQQDLIESAIAFATNRSFLQAQKASELIVGTVWDSASRVSYNRGFWYGFAAGAFGVMLALAVTWLLYGGAN